MLRELDELNDGHGLIAFITVLDSSEPFMVRYRELIRQPSGNTIRVGDVANVIGLTTTARATGITR